MSYEEEEQKDETFIDKLNNSFLDFVGNVFGDSGRDFVKETQEKVNEFSSKSIKSFMDFSDSLIGSLNLKDNEQVINDVDFDLFGWPIFTHHLRVDPPITTGEGFYVYKYDLYREEFYDEDADASIMVWKCAHLTIELRLSGYTNTTSLSDSWDDGNIRADLGYEVDFSAMGGNVWVLLATILTFQTIETGILALDVVLNTLVSLPVWVSIAYLLYRIVTGLIPTLSGGGGA